METLAEIGVCVQVPAGLAPPCTAGGGFGEGSSCPAAGVLGYRLRKKNALRLHAKNPAKLVHFLAAASIRHVMLIRVRS